MRANRAGPIAYVAAGAAVLSIRKRHARELGAITHGGSAARVVGGGGGVLCAKKTNAHGRGLLVTSKK